jgi:CheY-like chemotaxis protein
MRILFVEDSPTVLEATSALLRRVFSAAEIETATTGREAREKIDRASRTGRVFDIALLDLKIPPVQGEPAELDLQLCDYARQAFPDVVVIHYSAWASEQEVQEHVQRLVGYDTIVDKSVKGAPRILMQVIRQGFGDKLAARTRAALGGAAGGPGSGSGAERMLRGGQTSCGTAEVNALLGEIRESFAMLDERNKKEIRHFVSVDETSRELQVTVGSPPRDEGKSG